MTKRSIKELLARARKRSKLTEAEAMKLAVAETQTARQESRPADSVEVYTRAKNLIGRFSDGEGVTKIAADHDGFRSDSFE